MQSFLQYRKLGRQIQRQLDNASPSLHISTTDAAHAQDAQRLPPSELEPYGKDEEDPDQNLPLRADNHVQAAQSGLGRSFTSSSALTFGTRLSQTMTGIEVRDHGIKHGQHRNNQLFVVGFQGPNDPSHPQNWSILKRSLATLNIGCIAIVVGIAGSIDSAVLLKAAREFRVSDEVESLATGIFLIGFGVGSLFAGPVSETVGRNPVYIGTLLIYMIWIMAAGLAPNIASQLVFRFLAGLFGATPLTCSGGSTADMWTPMQRVYSFSLFVITAFIGPSLGPFFGGLVADPSSLVGWRWSEWISLIVSGIVLVSITLFQPETYTPILLKWKAEHLRNKTGDNRFVAPIEVDAESFMRRLSVALYRPFVLTTREPIVICIGLYLAVVWVILFTFLDGYAYIFGETGGIHNLRPSLQGTCFFGIVVGLFLAALQVPLVYSWAKRDMQKIKEAGGSKLPPEFRLWFAMLGGAVCIPVSLFWMGWTADSDISIWSPLMASVLFGYGIMCVFSSGYQYTIDSYEIYAASALAGQTMLRYILAGVMVVVGLPFYSNVGVHYTLTILACISAIMAPLPYVLYKYGPAIRKYSKFAVSDNPAVEGSKGHDGDEEKA